MKLRITKVQLNRAMSDITKAQKEQYEKEHAHNMLVTFTQHGIDLTDTQIYHLVKKWRPDFDNLGLLKLLRDLKYTREHTLNVHTGVIKKK